MYLYYFCRVQMYAPSKNEAHSSEINSINPPRGGSDGILGHPPSLLSKVTLKISTSKTFKLCRCFPYSPVVLFQIKQILFLPVLSSVHSLHYRTRSDDIQGRFNFLKTKFQGFPGSKLNSSAICEVSSPIECLSHARFRKFRDLENRNEK